MSKDKLKILIAEHSQSDVDLLEHELKSAGIEYISSVVATESSYTEGLIDFDPDIILSDYTFPSFYGPLAFRIKERITPETPFIFVSGTIGEENAVQLIKDGVSDYVLKDKLFTLPQKIDRALRETTERKERLAITEKLITANYLYAFISQLNQNIVHVKDEATLFRNACNLAVKFGNFQVAWIGLYDSDRQTISLVEEYGLVATDLALFSDASIVNDGPQTAVLKTGKHFICEDIRSELLSPDWVDFGNRNGLNSFMVLPLVKAGIIIGTLNLYSSEVHLSDAQETKLLIEISGDISFALDLFEKTKRYNEAMELISSNEKQFRHTLDNMLEGMQIHDFNYRYLYVNNAVVKSGIYCREELIGYSLMEKYPGIEQTEVFAAITRCLKQRKAEHLETKFTFPDGKTVDFELSIEPIPEGVSILSIDRTEQNKAREKVLKVNRLYNFISAINKTIVHKDNALNLLKSVCDIAIEIGRFEVAYFNMIDQESGILNMVSVSGSEQIKLLVSGFSGYSVSDSALSGTPTGQVLATGKWAVSHDVQNDPGLAPWSNHIAAFNVKSAMSLPITVFGKLVGVFGLFSTSVNFFDEEEIKLLEEASGDVSFALEIFEKEKIQKATDLKLKINEARFRVLIEKGIDLKTLSTEEGDFIYGSPSIQQVMGYAPEEVLRMNVFDILHPDEVQGYNERRNFLLTTRDQPFEIQMRLKHKDGTWRWCEGTITNMLHEPGIHALVSNFRDVSEKELAEQQKEFDKNNISAMINNTNDLLWSVDKDFKLITSNQPFDEMGQLNFGRVFQRGDNILDSSHTPEMYRHFRQLYERAFTGESFTEISHFRIPTEFWTEISYSPIRKGDEIIGVACNSRDVTQSKIAERKLRESEAFNSGVLNSLSSHIAVIDSAGTIVAVNESWKRFAHDNGDSTLLNTGVGSNYYHVCEKSALALEPGASDALNGIKDVMNGVKPDYYLEYPCDSPTEKRWFGLTILKFGSSDPMVVVSHQNISERKRAEQNLQQSESRLKQAQALSHIGNWEYDLQTNIHLWSDELFTIFGIHGQKKVPSMELFLSFVHPEDITKIKNIVEEGFSTLRATSYQFRFIRSDGELRYGHTERKFEFDQNGKALRLLGVLHDITERKLIEEERDKMISSLVQHTKNLEQFTSIISHNLRAPVANILGLSQVLKNNISAEDRSQSEQYLFTSAAQLDVMLKDLNIILQVKSEINEHKETIYFGELVDTIKSSIYLVMKREKAQIITDFSEQLNITSLRSYLYSIFYNLITNSIKYKRPGAAPVIRIKSEISGDKIRISFKDNGLGIDLIKHGLNIFGLYKRFHDHTEGKGMGLFMVKTQVETLGGTITAESTLNTGSEFIIELPAQTDPEHNAHTH